MKHSAEQMIELPEVEKDFNRYILKDRQPVACHDTETWQAFMTEKDNVLLAHDQVGQYQVFTVFLGFNYGNADQPRFFQTTFVGGSSSKPRYAATWDRAMLEHKGKVKCGEGLIRFATERAAGIDRSFRCVDCKVFPGEMHFVVETEAEAIKALPKNKKHWERRGNVIVFLFGFGTYHDRVD